MNKFLSAIAAALVLAACSSAPKTNSAAASTNAPQTDAASQDNAKNNSHQNKATTDAESVYFDFDKFDIKPQFREAVKHQAEWMKTHKKDVVTLEGNTDERGSAEYNLALGNKRAAAVHKTLVILGIPQNRIKDVSFGKEKPKAVCNEEKCWAENRRVDFVHKPG